MRGEADCQCEDGLAIEYTRDSVGGLLDRFGRDVEMRDGSTAAGSLITGALSATPCTPPPAVAPAHAEIHVVRMSAQASLLASQQL